MDTRTAAKKPSPAHPARETTLSGCSHHQTDKPTALLSDEHRVIERVLAAVDELTERPVLEGLEAWRKALDFIRHFADQCHHLKEEKILFPALEAHGIPNDGGPIGMMLLEHEEARSYVGAMCDALGKVAAGDPSAQAALVDNAKRYVRLLHEHIQKEDDILFRMAEELIPEEEQRQISESFETHEADAMGTAVHEKYLKIAVELEEATRRG